LRRSRPIRTKTSFPEIQPTNSSLVAGPSRRPLQSESRGSGSGSALCNLVGNTTRGQAAATRRPTSMPKAKDVIGYAQDKKAVMVDLKFMDFLGLWQHFTIPLAELTEGVFDEGLGFDGSSIRGWMPIHNSDMLVVPDTDTAVMDPFMKDPTLSLICNIVDPITKAPYARDPRFIAQKAEKYLKSSGIGDAAYFGPEAEFFIFDGISYDSGVNHASYRIQSREGQWETGSATETTFDGKTAGTRPNLGYKPRYKEGYFPVGPIDSQQDLRTEMC